jgi:beta-N-acetylhexosaminidase
MTLQEKVGQMLLLGWQGKNADSVNSHAKKLIDELAVGGVIVFTRNAGAPEELKEALNQLQTRAAARGLPPLFVSIDQEGGRVSRLAPPHYVMPPSGREIGMTGDSQQARQAAKSIADVIKPLGFNWDFAPVLDIDNNPHNPVIGERSYSNDPQTVAAMGVAAIQGFQDDGGILACGKHFPGHGDTDTDSHLALPTIRHPRAHLDQVELVPFRAAISAGLEAIMTAHILFPEIDPDRPATLSPDILTGLLREEMGFSGLIITDCLEMKGVASEWGSPQAAVMAVQAGADLLLCCHTWETQWAIREALVQAVQDHLISEDRIDGSLERIVSAKRKWVS